MDKCAQCYRRFLDGDESAVGEIMDELFFKLVLFVDRYLHDVHASEDVALDVMSDLFVYKRRYNFSVSLKTYVFMLGKSRAIDHLRHRKALNAAVIEEAEDLADERGDLIGKVIADERKRELYGAVGRLPEDMRTAVHLVYFEEMTYDEAAKVMKKSRKQIDNLLYRAKKELRKSMGES